MTIFTQMKVSCSRYCGNARHVILREPTIAVYCKDVGADVVKKLIEIGKPCKQESLNVDR